MSKSVNEIKASFKKILEDHSFKMGEVIVARQIKSTIGRPKNQGDTIKCLGFKSVYDSVKITLTLDMLGRINKVMHLLELKKSA